MYAKLAVSLFIIVILSFVVVGAQINSSNATVVTETPALEILPVEETPLVIQPIEETTPNTLTGSLVIEPVVEQTILTTIMELLMDKISVIRGQLVQLTASLFYGDGSPAVNKGIDFYAGEVKIGSDITDNVGKAKLLWDTSPFGANVYVISAEYVGENGVEGSSAGANVVITEVLPETANTSLLTAAAVVAPVVTAPVEKIESCTTVQFQDTEHVYGTCTQNMVRCSGLGNSTCATVEEEYRCETGQQVVTKSYQQCTTTKLRVNNGQKIVEIDLKEYACSNTESGSMITVICDSKYDGNGDGKCNSGESCQQILVNGTTIQKLEKNSDDEYRADDESYFMQDISMVVIQ